MNKQDNVKTDKLFRLASNDLLGGALYTPQVCFCYSKIIKLIVKLEVSYTTAFERIIENALLVTHIIIRKTYFQSCAVVLHRSNYSNFQLREYR